MRLGRALGPCSDGIHYKIARRALLDTELLHNRRNHFFDPAAVGPHCRGNDVTHLLPLGLWLIDWHGYSGGRLSRCPGDRHCDRIAIDRKSVARVSSVADRNRYEFEPSNIGTTGTVIALSLI